MWQASGLEQVRHTLIHQYNITDVQFFIINSKLFHAVENVGELARRVSFPVYQDTEAQGLWELLQGGKDDTLIYDRCGRLTRHIPYPESLLSKRNFQDALFDAYYNNPCNCVESSAATGDLPQESVSPQRHHPHHSGQHSRNRHGRRNRQRRHAAIPNVVLHRNRLSEILSNRISN